MEIVHVTCGSCGSSFQTERKALEQLPLDMKVGSRMECEMSHNNGSMTVVGIDILNNQHDICPRCAIRVAEVAVIELKERAEKLMKATLTSDRRKVDG